MPQVALTSFACRYPLLLIPRTRCQRGGRALSGECVTFSSPGMPKCVPVVRLAHSLPAFGERDSPMALLRRIQSSGARIIVKKGNPPRTLRQQPGLRELQLPQRLGGAARRKSRCRVPGEACLRLKTLRERQYQRPAPTATSANMLLLDQMLSKRHCLLLILYLQGSFFCWVSLSTTHRAPRLPVLWSSAAPTGLPARLDAGCL